MEPAFTEINIGPFRMSRETDQLFAAMAIAQGSFGVVTKDKKADIGTYSYAYADLGSVIDACKGQLSGNGLCILQPASTRGNKVTVTTMIAHKSGQWIASDLELTAAQATPQGIGSAITYARRYGYSAMAGVVSEHDDDGGEASNAPSQKAPPKKAAASKPAERPAASPSQPATVSASNSPLEVEAMLLRMKDKYSILAEFSRMKKELMGVLGNNEGELRYYDILSRHGVNKSDQFKMVGDSKRAAKDMQEALLRINPHGVSEADIPEYSDAN
jgi:hypothetical protein